MLLGKGPNSCVCGHRNQLEGHVPMIEMASAVCAELLELVPCAAMTEQPEMSSHVCWKVKIDLAVLVPTFLPHRRDRAIHARGSLNLCARGRGRAGAGVSECARERASAYQ